MVARWAGLTAGLMVVTLVVVWVVLKALMSAVY